MLVPLSLLAAAALAPQAEPERALRHVRVVESAGGEALHVRVRAVATDSESEPESGGDDEPTTASPVLDGTTDVAITPGRWYRIEITRDDATRIATLRANAADERTVELAWDALGLVRADAEDAVRAAWSARAAAITHERDAELRDRAITAAGQTLRWRERAFGQAPPGEKSLWISLHGGGGTTTQTNDEQWQNQVRLYAPAEGIYVAPRAPTDTWDLWHQAHIDALLDRLIETFVAARGVDPDRVFVLGYSAGGDGVYQLAPRLADRFAAAAMMAGHPNDASPVGLRNLPFAIFMGGKDTAYRRNEVAAEWGAQLDALRAADADGYPHKTTIYADCGHWMDRRDAEAVPWMAAFRREPWPKRIVWRQDDVVHDRFYWLAVEGDAKPGDTMTAEVTGQTVRIGGGPERVRLLLRDGLVDLDRPVRVERDGRCVFEGIVLRTQTAIDASLRQRADPRACATAEVLLSRA